MKLLESLKFAFKKYVIKSYLFVFSLILTVASIVFIFVPLTNKELKVYALIILVAILTLTFILNYLILKNRKSIKIKINQTDVTIRFGDIFRNKDFDKKTYRLIGVNDYFDTHLGDGIIDGNTLHGKYLIKYNESCKDLDERILADKRLLSEIACTSPNRAYNKTNKYELGSIFLIEKPISSS